MAEVGWVCGVVENMTGEACGERIRIDEKNEKAVRRRRYKS